LAHLIDLRPSSPCMSTFGTFIVGHFYFMTWKQHSISVVSYSPHLGISSKYSLIILFYSTNISRGGSNFNFAIVKIA